MKKIFTEPLFHFLFIGAALFISFELFNDSSAGDEAQILITEADIKTLQANFMRTWSRPPTEEEMSALVTELVRDEIAFREASAMGLDKDDLYIRKRLRTKLELLLEDFAAVSTPSDEELKQYLMEHQEDFSIPARITLQQIYFNPKERGQNVLKDVEEALALLTTSGTSVVSPALGDVTMLPAHVRSLTPQAISRQFGASFRDEILSLPVGVWTGPVRSSYGLHLVMVTEKIPARVPALEEVRNTVERELMAKRRQEVKEQTYTRLREQYKVTIESGSEDGSSGNPEQRSKE